MAKLTWGNFGHRLYEAGVSNGVLYVPSQPAVVWNGLVSISENPAGGEAKAYYLDGTKYLNVSESEEYEATLVAYMYPDIFGVCDGSVSIHPGLFATRQPRRPFSLSYKTILGNDVSGPDHAYKIHIVYNALAAPSQRPRTTFGGTTEPTLFRWDLTTLPPSVTGYKRTAHYVIDSRTTPADILAEVEDLLYGSESTDAELPTPDELIAIFAP